MFIVSPYRLEQQLCALADGRELHLLVHAGDVVVTEGAGDESWLLLPLALGLGDRTRLLFGRVAGRAARVTLAVGKGIEQHPYYRVCAMTASNYHNFVAAISLHGMKHFLAPFGGQGVPRSQHLVLRAWWLVVERVDLSTLGPHLCLHGLHGTYEISACAIMDVGCRMVGVRVRMAKPFVIRELFDKQDSCDPNLIWFQERRRNL